MSMRASAGPPSTWSYRPAPVGTACPRTGSPCFWCHTIGRDKQFEVVLDNIKVGADALLGEEGNGFAVLDKVLKVAAVAKCAEIVGGAQFVIDMTVQYAIDRSQFGQPIGKFQAIQHLASNMEIDLNGSRYITQRAAWKMSEGLDCDFDVFSAKGFVNTAYRRICANGHQIGAASAYMEEHDMPL